jgi:WG containing repeat
MKLVSFAKKNPFFRCLRDRYRAPFGSELSLETRGFERCHPLMGSRVKLCFFFALFLMMSGKLVEGQNLYAFERDEFYGFRDKTGKATIRPVYGAVKPFSEGLAPVYQAGVWGFINSEGKMMITPGFWGAEAFSEGLAAVHQRGGWGYVDSTGKVVVKFQFLQAGQFSEGVAPVRVESGWLFVDKSGKAIEGLSGFDDAQSFSEGVAAVQMGGKWRFVTHEGKKRFEQDFAQVSKFTEDLAAVQEKEDGQFGYIDQDGNYLIEPQFEDAKGFAEGLAAVRLNGRWGYIDKKGSLRILNNYPFFADDFSGGLAVVSDPVRGADIYIDAEGKPQFFKSSKAPDTNRGTSQGSICSLELSSQPLGADVYLVPLYIWEKRDENEGNAPKNLDDLKMQEYLKVHFDFWQGQTKLKVGIIEQNYMGLFVLGGNIKRRLLLLAAGENSFLVPLGQR